MKEKLRLLERMDLLDEPIPLQPLIELCGDRRVLVENHGGILDYGSEMIVLQVRFGSIRIMGSGLKICRMQKKMLIISGRIDSVTLERGRK